MKPPRISRASSLAVAIAALLAAGGIQGASLYWDTNGTTVGAQHPTTPIVTGTWGTSGSGGNAYWNTIASGSSGGNFLTITTSSTDNLFFSAGVSPTNANAGWAGTVTVSGTQNASSVTFDDAKAITLTGGTIVQSSGISVTTGTVTIESIINSASSTSGGVSVAGSGTLLTLSGVNTYQGATQILSSATLIVTSASNLGSSPSSAANITLAGTLRYNGSTTTTTDRLFTLASASGATIESTGSGAIQFTSTGTVAEATPNTAYTLILGGTSTGANQFSPVLTNNGTAALALTKNGAGTWEIMTSQSYTNGTTINQGVLKLGQATNTLSDSGSVTVEGGTLSLGGNNDTVGQVIMTAGAITSTSGKLTGDGYDFRKGTVSAILDGTAQVIKTTADMVTMSGTNLYSGGTLLTQGVLALGSEGALGTSGLVEMNGGTLQFSTDNKVDYTATSRLQINEAKIGIFDTNEQNVVFGSAITAAGDLSGGLTKIGIGSLTLSAANLYTGLTTVSAGTLVLGDTSNTLVNSGNISVEGGTLSLGTNSDTVNFVSLVSGSITGTGGVLSATTGFEVSSGSASAILGGAGNLSKLLSDTVILTGANTYTGGTTVGEGALVLAGGNDRLLTSGIVTIGSPELAGKLVLGDSSAASNQTLKGLLSDGLTGNVIGGNGTTNSVLTFNPADTTSYTFGGVLGGGGTNENKLSLLKSGLGTQQLDGVNTYTGNTTVSAGTLTLGVDGSINSSAIITVGNAGSSGAILDTTAKTGFTILNGQILKGIGTVNVGTDKSLTIDSGGIYSPGNSPGVQTVDGNLHFTTGSIFEWELTANTSDQGTAPAWIYDQVVGNGGTLTIDDGAIFRIILKGTGSTVDYNNNFWDSAQQWTAFFGFASVTGKFSVESQAIQDINSQVYTTYVPRGNFTMNMNSGTLDWTVPEPSSALAGLLLGAGLLRRRRDAVKI